ncbi:kinesin-like protein KIN-UC isoform X1 [Cucurbita moschata]|uniref:Kinesin-like protein KIN-UC isoform X1 n=1 Tax=Cucurbita moschata TaxID=3662 RepID=A0A6J1ECS9_CUCMO|nr:kinesin-like protein KIN-UC isoform X1 [Cucurbita moschata]
MASSGGGIGGSGGNSFRYSLRSERQGVHHHVPISSAHSSSFAFPIAASKSVGHGQSLGSSARNKASSASRRSLTPNLRSCSFDVDEDSQRVRVAVRVRPRNAEDLLSDADFADCVELQPELKRLKLRKNNWSSESYQFDEVFTESASQRRVYEVVAKPVVECVLNGYNGTIMAYGQTGTGKTYTLGRMGKEDVSERGIMVRALEDIIANVSPTSDSVEISYLQLYMESVQDLLAPEKVNIPINEDPKTGEVSAPGATVVKIQDIDHFLQLLEISESNRHAANTKLNTESSRSHAILMVYVRRAASKKNEDMATTQGHDHTVDFLGGNGIPMIRKSKLLVVDLAGSERINKSGSEGHLLEEAKFINLSLTSLGKCINALAENNTHIPTRDSKLTRLLRDSFGGSARTSLIITIGPSSRYHAETASTIMFGQRAMKIVNMIKLKEEFDYESLCRKLENQADNLTAEVDRQQKLRENEKYKLEKELRLCQASFAEVKNSLITRCEFLEKENTQMEKEMADLLIELNRQRDHNDLMHDKVSHLEMSLEHSKQHQLENYTYQKVLADTTQMYEKNIADLKKQLEVEHARFVSAKEEFEVMKKILCDHKKLIQQHETDNSAYKMALAETTQRYEKKMAELTKQLEDKNAHFEAIEEQLRLAKSCPSDNQNSIQKEIEELKEKLKPCQSHENTLTEFQSLKSEHKHLAEEKEKLKEELYITRQKLLFEEKQRKTIENELVQIQRTVPVSGNDFEDQKSYMRDNIHRQPSSLGTPMGFHETGQLKETNSSQRETIAKICEEVGLQKILQLLTSEDTDVQVHAVKVVANLAAEESNQEKIVDEGGLDALLMLLQSSKNLTIFRVASGAIANLAMNERNQGVIMSKGGAQLLARTASRTDDPQTLRMVAGALANLCGNEKLHKMLKDDGGIRALLEMATSGNSDVIAQVARGMANFAKCESRAIVQGRKKGRSLLMEDGALPWLLNNSHTNSASARRHIELALCHLAQNVDNAADFVACGGVKELLERISRESFREDIRNLARKMLRLNSTFQA